MLAILSSAKQGLNQFPSATSLCKSPLYHFSAHFQLYPLQKKKRSCFELIPLASFLACHSCTITTTACRSAHLLFISVVDSEGLGVRLRPASSVQRFPGGHCLLFLLKLKAKATQLSFTHTARLAIHAPHSIPLLSWFPPPPNLSDGLIFGPICKTITHRQATFAIWYPLQTSQLVLNDDSVLPHPKTQFSERCTTGRVSHLAPTANKLVNLEGWCILPSPPPSPF